MKMSASSFLAGLPLKCHVFNALITEIYNQLLNLFQHKKFIGCYLLYVFDTGCSFPLHFLNAKVYLVSEILLQKEL